MTNLNREQLSLSWKAWYGNSLDPVGPGWLQWVWTTAFCFVIAMCFTVLALAINATKGGDAWIRADAWLRTYGSNLVVSLIIGYTIHSLFALLIPLVGTQRIRAFSYGQRALFFSVIPIAGVMIGWPVGLWIVSPDAAGHIERMGPGLFVGIFLFALLISFILFQIFNAKMHQAEAEKRAVEAQLRLLQAQMEPHFLFNTLAGVLTLIEAEPARARRLLESFTDYLRATLANLRTERSTVEREIELAAAYLQLMQLRMEDRLQFSIGVDEEARREPIPPLLLQPLVENAIQHGLEAKIDGGRVEVEARLAGNDLLLVVSDNGLGPDAPARHRPGGNGVALDNMRQRLHGLHGNAATLTIASLQPGTRATLRLPRSKS
ncbi:sensor histidine kinase [Piscinibacter sakaiensis]|uniref:sensor histidine kinase n=1 Tax=Piscinibacter sakaiensis TaxID=1547922 RepID=UPI003AAAA389